MSYIISGFIVWDMIWYQRNYIGNKRTYQDLILTGIQKRIKAQ